MCLCYQAGSPDVYAYQLQASLSVVKVLARVRIVADIRGIDGIQVS